MSLNDFYQHFMFSNIPWNKSIMKHTNHYKPDLEVTSKNEEVLQDHFHNPAAVGTNRKHSETWEVAGAVGTKYIFSRLNLTPLWAFAFIRLLLPLQKLPSLLETSSYHSRAVQHLGSARKCKCSLHHGRAVSRGKAKSNEKWLEIQYSRCFMFVNLFKM